MNFPNNLTRLLLVFCSLGFVLPAFAADKPYPLDYWALRDVVSNVSISPDGKYLGLMKIQTRDADPVIEVYDTSDFNKKPFVFDADPMEISFFYWAGDQDIIVSFRQRVRDKIEGFNRGVYETKLALLDVKKRKVRQFRETGASIVNTLPNKPNKVILAFNPGGDERIGSIDRAFRPRAYYEFDIETERKTLLMQGKLSMGQLGFNSDGIAWTARGYDRGKDEFIWYIKRLNDDAKWEEVFRLHEDSFENFSIRGYDEKSPDIIFVLANNGRDKQALWEFDINTRSFGEIIYARNDVNVSGVQYHSNAWTNDDTVVGVSYNTDKRHVEYFDALEGATYAQLEGVIPDAYNVSITSRSRDGAVLTVYNSGPHDPGSYYLIKDGKLKAIGSKQPLLKSADLADVKYINYPSRDGKTIHAYITVPHGEPPFPTIVMPHGGPFVSETVSWDEWGQMLANNGYLILQPQYRGSTNYGLDFYMSAFKDGGEGGHKMQDDKDDGVLHLIKEGLTDSDKVAMFGWSYGGYAALVAASRTPQLYQCVVAGAAVSDTLMQVTYYSSRMRGSAKIQQMNMWVDSISPIDEASKVNVPLMLIHGSVDQRVPPEHVRRYMDELDKHNKPYKYVELDGADHFYSTLFFDHQMDLYKSLRDFVRDDCGPGGLKN